MPWRSRSRPRSRGWGALSACHLTSASDPKPSLGRYTFDVLMDSPIREGLGIKRPRSMGAFIFGFCFPALACAPVPPMGATVDIANEEAIIVWDSSSKTQHFIRRAAFDTTAKDFGFLVPTPTLPQLAEADDAAFGMLSGKTAARVIRREMVFTGALVGLLASLIPSSDHGDKRPAMKAAAPVAPVTVLLTAKVAGFDAVVLEATEADALDNWLKKNGYVSSPELVDWYKPYIAAKWKITAFKIASDAPQVATSAVRMSFTTSKPFFPYREPAAVRSPQSPGRERLLRVFLLADARFDGNVGETGTWPGKAAWSNRLPEEVREHLIELTKLPITAGKQSAWLTEFEDKSSPRPGTDEVYFKRAADQSTLKRPDIVTGPSVWLDLGVSAIVLAILAGVIWVFVRIARAVYRLAKH